MKLRQVLFLGLLSSAWGCAGSVETIDGDGDGDGDAHGDGDGDTVSPGDPPRATPGDPGDPSNPPTVDPTNPGSPVEPTRLPTDPGVPVDPTVVSTGGSPGVEPPIYPGGGPTVLPPIYPGGGPGVLPPDPIDPATCTDTYEYSDYDYCELEAQCGGAWAYVWCDSYSGEASCGCDRPGGYFNVQLDPSFVSGGSACQDVLDACLGATELTVVGEPVCEPQYFEQDSNYCGTNLQCETPVDFGGVQASIQTWTDAWCENYDGNWTCDCYSGQTSGRVVFEGQQSSPDVCLDAISVCQGGLLDPALPAVCEPRSQYADGQWCDFELQCSQDRAIAGVSAQVSAWQYGGCQLSSEGVYQCSCGGDSSSFSVSADSAWSACSAASAECTF